MGQSKRRNDSRRGPGGAAEPPMDRWVNGGGKRAVVRLDTGCGHVLERRAGKITRSDGGDGDDADVEKPDAFTMFFKGLFDNIKYIYELILNLFKDEWPGEGGFIAHVLTIVALALAVVTASGLLVFCWKMLKKRGETTSSKTKKTSSTNKKKGSSGNDEDKGTMVVLLNMIQKLMEKDEK